MRRVIQMTMSYDTANDFHYESRIAGMTELPGFIAAFAVASKSMSTEVDKIVAYFEDGYPDYPLAKGQRYAWIA